MFVNDRKASGNAAPFVAAILPPPGLVIPTPTIVIMTAVKIDIKLIMAIGAIPLSVLGRVHNQNTNVPIMAKAIVHVPPLVIVLNPMVHTRTCEAMVKTMSRSCPVPRISRPTAAHRGPNGSNNTSPISPHDWICGCVRWC